MDRGSSLLADRGVISVSGAEATAFLHRLATNNMLGIRPGEGRYAAILTPQGKLLFDFFVVPSDHEGSGFLLDCVKSQIPELLQKLNFHKLRAKIAIEDLSEKLAVAAIWGDAEPPAFEGIGFSDPRIPALGFRLIAPPADLEKFATTPPEVYEARRVALGVPKGGIDFAYGDAFVHDADLDWLNGVDFKKGCYPGQEVVARVHFRNSARKRILKVRFDGPVPQPGCEVMMGEISIGQVGSTAGTHGLAMLRLDRLEDAKNAGIRLIAGEAGIEVTPPN
ncbi:MAG TPA: folate-binding protein [Methylovirgula sp.]|nr:folate-binding protein [Methylovirgula sp.]